MPEDTSFSLPAAALSFSFQKLKRKQKRKWEKQIFSISSGCSSRNIRGLLKVLEIPHNVISAYFAASLRDVDNAPLRTHAAHSTACCNQAF